MKTFPVTRTPCGFPFSLADSWSSADDAFHRSVVYSFIYLGFSIVFITHLILSEPGVDMHSWSQFFCDPSSHLGILRIPALPT